MATFRIDSADGPGGLELEQISLANWLLRVVAPGLEIGIQVDGSGYRYVEGLGDFFGRLADDWRGWDGPREWYSLEGEYGFVATHDGLGHIHIRVRVRENAYDGWTCEVGIKIEAGQLDAVTRAAKRFDATAY